MNLEIADGDVRHESNVHKKIKSNFHRIVESMRTESLGRSWCFRSQHFSYDISSSRRSNELNRMGTSALSQQIFFYITFKKVQDGGKWKKSFCQRRSFTAFGQKASSVSSSCPIRSGDPKRVSRKTGASSGSATRGPRRTQPWWASFWPRRWSTTSLRSASQRESPAPAWNGR